MPSSDKLQITDLEFDTIKSNLTTFLKSQSQFQDYDFEGSGMAVLVDLLAYNTHYMGYYANMLGNEMFLDSSSLRESVVSHAKHLNVHPTSRKASRAKLDINFFPPAIEGTNPAEYPISLTIFKDTKFTTSINGTGYTFTTNQTTTVPRLGSGDESTYSAYGVEVIEGRILRNAFTVNGADDTQRFIIPNSGIDVSTVVVKCQKSATDTTVETFTDGNALDVTTIKGTDKVFFLHEVEEQKYELTFGDGAIGKSLSDGNIIFVEYIVSSGTVVNKASKFSAVSSVANLNLPQYSIISVESASGGAEAQSIESLQFQAPKLYQAQKRATTRNDYKAIILEQRPDIESIVVYGGEDADPVQYGKVFIGLKPNGNNTYSTATKEAIKNSVLKKVNVVTVIPEIVDPIFYYILVDTIVNYDPVSNLTDEETLKLNINTSIQNYFQTNLEKFDQKFRYSQLIQDIDNTNNSIRNNLTNIKYRQLISPAAFNTPATYNLNFNNKLEKGSVVSTSFTATDGLTYSFVDDSVGKIQLAKTTNGAVNNPKEYFIQPDGSTTQGTIDFTTGKIVLNSFRPLSITDNTSNIKFTVTPEINNSDITPLREQILTYDATDTETINISMVAETI
jgi:hypothetical protein